MENITLTPIIDSKIIHSIDIGSIVSEQSSLTLNTSRNHVVESNSSNAPYTAGIPVLELVRKLEDEKLFTRHDRSIFKDAFNNPNKRDKILKALRDVELGTNKRFAVRRLKAIIHQNGSGEPSNSKHNSDQNQTLSVFIENNVRGNDFVRDSYNEFQLFPDQEIRSLPSSPKVNNSINNNINNINTTNTTSSYRMKNNTKSNVKDENDEQLSPINNPKVTIIKVMGESPQYAGTGSETICNKIAARIKEFFVEYQPNKLGARKFGIIVGQGSFNPITRMHMRTYFLAKQELESRYGYIILGSLLSPAHSVTVRERYRTNSSEIIPSPHRLAIAQLMVQDSKWLTIDPWEITRRRTMDYLALLDHVSDTLKQQFPDIEIKIIYLCKSNIVPKLSPDAFKVKQYNCVSVCRAPESDHLRSSLGSKWNGIIHIVEDMAILDSSMDVVTSRGVREKIKKGESIDHLVGDTVSNYVNIHKLGPKMNGLEEWTEDEKSMPVIASSRSQLMLYDRRSQSSLQQSSSKPSDHTSNIAITSASTKILIQDDLHLRQNMPQTINNILSPSSIVFPVISPIGVNSNVTYNSSSNDEFMETEPQIEQLPPIDSAEKVEVTIPTNPLPSDQSHSSSSNKNELPLESPLHSISPKLSFHKSSVNLSSKSPVGSALALASASPIIDQKSAAPLASPSSISNILRQETLNVSSSNVNTLGIASTLALGLSLPSSSSSPSQLSSMAILSEKSDRRGSNIGSPTKSSKSIKSSRSFVNQQVDESISTKLLS